MLILREFNFKTKFEVLRLSLYLLKLTIMSSSPLTMLDLILLLNSFYALQLRALSHILQTPIEVVQMDSPSIIVGEEYSGKPITLV